MEDHRWRWSCKKYYVRRSVAVRPLKWQAGRCGYIIPVRFSAEATQYGALKTENWKLKTEFPEFQEFNCLTNSLEFSQKVGAAADELYTSTGRTIYFWIWSEFHGGDPEASGVQGLWIQWTENSLFSFQSKKVPVASVFWVFSFQFSVHRSEWPEGQPGNGAGLH